MLNNIFKFLKSLFYNNKDNAKLEDYQQPSDNSISFIFDDDNNVFLKISIKDFNQILSIKFGDLLFHMNEGYYAQSMMEIMTEIGSQGPEQFSFVKKAINQWGNKVLEAEKLEDENSIKPIISPSEFSNLFDK